MEKFNFLVISSLKGTQVLCRVRQNFNRHFFILLFVPKVTRLSCFWVDGQQYTVKIKLYNNIYFLNKAKTKKSGHKNKCPKVDHKPNNLGIFTTKKKVMKLLRVV